MQGFFNEYIEMWKNYANFSGRTSVRGYWMAFLVNFLVGTVLGAIVSAVPALSVITSLYALATMIPGLAIAIRRLRDAGKAWTWIFINFVPLVGWIIWIVMLCKPSADA